MRYERKPDKFSIEIVKLLRDVLRRKDRNQLASELSALLQHPVSRRMLDDFCSESKATRFPLAWTKPLCEILKDSALSHAALSQHDRDLLALGSFVWDMMGEEQRRILLGRSREKKGKG